MRSATPRTIRTARRSPRWTDAFPIIGIRPWPRSISGATVRVELVEDQDPDHLRYLGEIGLYPETVIRVLERDAAGLQVGAEATVVIDARPDREFQAEVAQVAELSRPIERGSPVKYTEVKIELADGDPECDAGAFPSFFA